MTDTCRKISFKLSSVDVNIVNARGLLFKIKGHDEKSIIDSWVRIYTFVFDCNQFTMYTFCIIITIQGDGYRGDKSNTN